MSVPATVSRHFGPKTVRKKTLQTFSFVPKCLMNFGSGEVSWCRSLMSWVRLQSVYIMGDYRKIIIRLKGKTGIWSKS